jgi:nanoRNase/pAp phosphatase (c-di-AMP/oligoRNAs hydrolase)
MSREYTRVVIYHGGCADGLASAFCFTPAAKGLANAMDDTYYHPMNEREFDKDTRMPDLTGKEVYIVDMSYPREILTKIAQIATSVAVFDHHPSSVMENPPISKYVIDLTKCAAEIT